MSEPKSLEELRPAEEVARATLAWKDSSWAEIPDGSGVTAVSISRIHEPWLHVFIARLIDRERKAAFEAGRRSVLGVPCPHDFASSFLANE